jgi:phosphate acetyltransferase
MASPDPLPILSVKTDTFTTAAQVNEVHTALFPDDAEKISLSIETFDKNVDLERLERQISAVRVRGITPKMFTYNLLEQARSDLQMIVLPEAYDPRILKATAMLVNKGVVKLTLLGNRRDLQRVLDKNSIQLDLDKVTLTHPSDSDQLHHYAETFYELRKHKGVTLDNALDVMMDVSYFGTMMVYTGDADGMVSGAVHTTQHTIRPALQFVKTKPGFSVVSSVFFMCLEHRVLVYGDCAINPNPTAEQLAEIAISSADTARPLASILKWPCCLTLQGSRAKAKR